MQAIAEPVKNNTTVTWAHFSRDGRLVVTTSTDNITRVWGPTTYEAQPIQIECGEFIRAQFAPNGATVLTSPLDNGRAISLWDAKTGALLKRTDPRYASSAFQNDLRETSVHGSRELRKLGNKAQILDGGVNASTLSIKPGGHVNSVEFSPYERIVTASDDRTARIRDGLTGMPLTEPLVHDTNVWLARFSADGSRIVTVSGKVTRIWDIAPFETKCRERMITTLPSHFILGYFLFSFLCALSTETRNWRLRLGCLAQLILVASFVSSIVPDLAHTPARDLPDSIAILVLIYLVLFVPWLVIWAKFILRGQVR